MNRRILTTAIAAITLSALPATGQVRGELLITNHGAVGDGVFDNAPIINSLLSGLPPSGGSVVIPHGDFRINSPLLVDKSYVTIRGLGPSSKLLVGFGVGDGIDVPAQAPRLSGLTLRGFHVAGLDGGIYQTGLKVVRATDGLHVEEMTFSGLGRGMYIRESDAAQLTGNEVFDCESSLWLDGGLVAVVTRNRFSGFSGGVSVELSDLDRALFSANIIRPDGHTALLMRNVHNCNVTGNSITSWYTGAIEVEGNMNSFSGNNISAVETGGTWSPDPLGRDGLWGLVRIRGNDNSFTSSSVMSWQPENDIRINVVSGERTNLRDLTIAAVGSDKKINVDPAASWTRITHCGWPQETTLNGNPTARVVYDP